MAGLDFSSLKPVAPPDEPQPLNAPPGPALDLSSLKPASEWTPPPAPPGDDVAGQFGAGLVTGIPNAVTMMANAAAKMNPITAGLNAVNDLSANFNGGKKVVPEEVANMVMNPGDVTSELATRAHVNPNDYFAEPKTGGERIARMAGEGAITSIMPGGEARGWQRLAQIAKELFAGTTSGAASQAAVEAAPDSLKPAAGIIGGLAGGVGGSLIAEAPGAAKRGVQAGADYLRPIVARDATDMAPEMAANTTAGRIAAQRLGAIASDPTAAAAAIGKAEEFVPGSKPTAFQASGDVGLGSYERALARGDDKFKAALLDRVDQQNGARVQALNSIESSGDVGGAVQFFRDRMRTLEDHADTLYDRAERAAKGQYDALGDRAAGDVGEQARTAIANKFKDMNGEASALWNSIDPKHDLNVATTPLVTATAKIYGAMSPEEALSLSSTEKNIAGIIGGYGDTLPFDRFKDLRSEITRGMRDAKSFASPNDRAYRRLSMLRDAVEQAVEQSVSQKFAADPSLAEQFVRQAKEWYAARTPTETGAAPAPSPVRGADERAPEPAAVSGTPRDQGLEPAQAPGDQGLPQNAARTPAVAEPAPVEAPALQPRAPSEPLPPGGAIQQLDPRDIGVDARRFQFKEGGDEKGVTERLQGVEQWDPRLAGTSLVYRDAAGKNWVADGHQRMGLANRLMENGHPPIKVNAFVLDAKDGITDADARAIAAVKNIAEGTGTPIDAAKVLRAAKESGIDLPPLPPRSTLVRDGQALANLSPEAFGMVINDVVPSAYGAIIGRMVKDPSAQEEAVRVIAAVKPDNARQVEMVVQDMLNSGVEQMTKQGGLFGEEAFASSVVLERAKIADQALKLLKQDKKLFGTLVGEAERIEGAGNALDKNANAARLSTDEKAADLLTQLAFRAGPVSTELTRLARALKAGDQTAHAAARDFLGAIRRAVEGGLDEGDYAGGLGSRAAGEEAPAPVERDPNTVEMFQAAPPVGAPEFRRWFGDSKVVDESGAPLVVYHATSAAEYVNGEQRPIHFDTFNTSNDMGAHFGTVQQAEGRAGEPSRVNPVRIYPAYLSIKNPLRVRDHGHFNAYDPGMLEELLSRGVVTGAEYKRIRAIAADENRDDAFYAADEAMKDTLRAKGYDGLVYLNRNESSGESISGMPPGEGETLNDEAFRHEYPEARDSYAVFDPTQIKSTFNRGTFDPSDPRILYQGKPAPWREGDMLGQFNTERGLEGLPQAVIPGTEVTDASRLQMAASKPLKGGEAPPPRGGLFDVRGREEEAKQGSLFQSNTGAPIRDTMAERFAAAGRPPEEAVAAGELVNAFYTTMAERLGKSVDDLTAEHPLPQVRKGDDPDAQLFQPAYHGTPHIFDKFDSSKIGTGEGAQAFGHGLYFAGRKEVAKYYRDVLSQNTGDKAADRAAYLLQVKGTRDAALAQVDSNIANLKERIAETDGKKKTSGPSNAYWREKLAEDEATREALTAGKGGRLLTVDIPHDDELLSWDKPLSEQPPKVKGALAKLGIKEDTAPKEIADPFIRRIVRDALKQTDNDPEQLALTVDNDSDLYQRAMQQAKREGLSADDVETIGGVGSYIEDRARGYLDALRGRATNTGEKLYQRLTLEYGNDPAAASKALHEAGIPGLRYLDHQARGEGEGAHNYVIFDDKHINVTGYEQAARGSIQFGDTGSVISMFKGADASTALHESGHHFLKMFKSMAEGPNAPESIANDWRAAKAWWDKNANDVAKDGGEGVTSADVRKVLREGTTGDRMKDLAVDRGLHEQWARGLETYLRDGKAPNSALRAIFQQFKDWLTSIYKNAGDLGVKMSPEIRQVFDRMLSTEQGPKMLDAEASGRFSKATAATRQIKDTFGAKPVKQILHRPGATYPYTMSPESVASSLFKAGPEGSAAIKNVKAAGAPQEAIESAAVLSLKRAASKDGMIDPAKLDAWRQKHGEALREVPELDRRLGDAARATETVANIGAKRKEVLDQMQRSAIGKLLKVEDDADVAATLGRMLGKDTAVRDMRMLASEARVDPDAMAGLRRGLVEHMMSRLKTPKDALRADTFQRFLGKNAPALSQVLTQEQMNAMQSIALDMKRASKEVRAPGGGSDTLENLTAQGRYGLEHPSILGQMLRRAMASGAVGLAAHFAQGPIMGAITGVGSFLGGSVVQALREAGIRRVDDLVREAVLDPELMKALLLKAPKRPNVGSSVTLRERLGRLAANNLAIAGARETQDRESARN